MFFPAAHADIDWNRQWESLDKEFQQVATEAEIGRRYVDKLVKVWLKNGEEQWVLIHVEVQMTDETDFPWRMYVYNCRIFVRYNREVASFAVLGDDKSHWRPNSYGYRRWGVEAGLRFPVVKLLDYAARRPELEESRNPFAMVVLAHLDAGNSQDWGERRPEVRPGQGLRRRGLSETQVRQLFKLIDWLMELPKPMADEFWIEIQTDEEKEHMPFITTPERYGRIEGRTEAFTESIETILEVRFPAASSQLMSEIRQIHDDQQLKNILRAPQTQSTPRNCESSGAAV